MAFALTPFAPTGCGWVRLLLLRRWSSRCSTQSYWLSNRPFHFTSVRGSHSLVGLFDWVLLLLAPFRKIVWFLVKQPFLFTLMMWVLLFFFITLATLIFFVLVMWRSTKTNSFLTFMSHLSFTVTTLSVFIVFRTCSSESRALTSSNWVFTDVLLGFFIFFLSFHAMLYNISRLLVGALSSTSRFSLGSSIGSVLFLCRGLIVVKLLALHARKKSRHAHVITA